MRALLGGAVGAIVAAAAWLAVEHYTQANFGWLVCLVGLVTGLSVSCAGGASARGSFANGALAIILTLAAIAGGQQVYAKIMQATIKNEGAKVVGVEKEEVDTEDPEDEEESADAGESEPAEAASESNREQMGLGKNAYTKSSIKKNFSEWDMVWMCIAALAAYVTGKGGGKAGSAVVTEAASDQQQDMAEDDGE